MQKHKSTYALNLFITIALCGFFSPASAQGEYNVWHFGAGAGLDFNSGSPVSLSAFTAIGTTEGSASICDSAGNVLFYTDGNTVWDRNDQPMPGGNGVLLGNNSSTQSALILPNPGNSNQYYIFTADQGGYINPNVGIHYSLVDMTLNNGLGDVAILNTQIQGPPMTEKIAATRHANCTDFWVVTHSFESNRFQAFQVTASGVLPPVLSDVGTPHVNTSLVFAETLGCMKISPDGRRVALAMYGTSPFGEAFDFDNSTGLVSNPVNFPMPQGAVAADGPYGVSFSPNSNVLYISYFAQSVGINAVYQYNMQAGTAAAIQASQQIVGSLPVNGITMFSSLQLGPDGKIYMAKFTNLLDVINNPDAIGAACNFQADAVPLFGSATAGLPNFLDGGFEGRLSISLGSDTLLCGGQFALALSPQLLPGNSYLWSTGSTAASITVNQPGTYAVQVSNVNCPGSASDTISVLQQPENSYPPEIFSCVQAVQISPSIPALPGSSYLWNNGDTTASISVNTPGNYFVTVSNGNCIFTDTVQVDFGNNGLTTGLNVFTPNGDGINDAFGFPNALPEGYTIEVYNRWGNSLFQSSNPAQLWDGTFNGSATEEGVYYWRLRTLDCTGNPTEEAGFVSLMR